VNLPPYVPDYRNFIPGKTPVLYSGPYWDESEVEMAVAAFRTGAWLTSGEHVARFQGRFAQRFNVRHAHMVNSGSSANLVMLAALKKRMGWQDGDEIIVSPVGFPTTIAPIVQNGLKPVFVDIEMSTLNFDLNEVERVINGRTKAIFVSPVLGNPPNMDRLRNLGPVLTGRIALIGDHCDSLGTRWNGQLLNELYAAWSTSFYPAHHITTGEGGMVCSDDRELIEIARSISSWGRACYCVGAANLSPCGTCGKRFSDWLGDGGVSDHKYVFDNMGYNLKPLDMQGAIGLAQLAKLDEIESKRRANFRAIDGAVYREGVVAVAAHHPKADPCWFGVPLICETEEIKNSLVKHFEDNKIQTRSYFAGNILRHPGYGHLGNAADFPNADQALKRVFFLGCPPHYTPEVIDYIGEVFRKW
jgi:CDP-4-dehydro-6-deoxyglucose reductase, E1